MQYVEGVSELHGIKSQERVLLHTCNKLAINTPNELSVDLMSVNPPVASHIDYHSEQRADLCYSKPWEMSLGTKSFRMILNAENVRERQLL